ncbi:unnamed protein product [Bathycoccus prasinos]
MSSSAHTACTALVGVRTRGQKRRIGERDSLWDLIVNDDDICFKHILPRLNGTDVKFLYEVNTETRALIKRSTRAGDLERRFNIGEMSSISTLEFAWEHKSLCTGAGVWYDERSFCWRVAKTNKLELLKWAREEKECDWGVGTINTAVVQGNLEMVKYCVASECPCDEGACAEAATGGHVDCLRVLFEELDPPEESGTEERVAEHAAEYGYPDVLKYLVEERELSDSVIEECVSISVNYSQLECLKYLVEDAEAPLDDWKLLAYARDSSEDEDIR